MNGTLASAVALTTSATASTNTAKCRGASKHSIILMWTPGTSGNVLTVTVEHRADIATGDEGWVQTGTWSATAGAKTWTANSYTYTASGTSEVSTSIPLEEPFQEYRIKYAESEAGGATKGTITAYWTSC